MVPLGTLDIRCRDPKRDHNFDNHPNEAVPNCGTSLRIKKCKRQHFRRADSAPHLWHLTTAHSVAHSLHLGFGHWSLVSVILRLNWRLVVHVCTFCRTWFARLLQTHPQYFSATNKCSAQGKSANNPQQNAQSAVAKKVGAQSKCTMQLATNFEG